MSYNFKQHNYPAAKPRWTRRAAIGATALAGAAGALYAAWPRFWNRYFDEARRPVLPPPARPDPARWPDRGLHAAWIGHSTVLLRIDGFTILTDPALYDRVGISVGPVTLGIKRMIAAALLPGEIPRVDLVLLSHAHMDHLDLASLRRIAGSGTVAVTASGTGDLVPAGRFQSIRELRWGDRTSIGPVQVGAFEVKHWGARLRSDTYRGYNGYVIDAGRYRVLFAGDTGWCDTFKHLRTAHPIDLAIMPIGCYNPYIRNHCTPEQALKMASDAGADRVLPIHHGTFQLSNESPDEPAARFLAAAGPGRVALSRIGEECHLV